MNKLETLDLNKKLKLCKTRLMIQTLQTIINLKLYTVCCLY